MGFQTSVKTYPAIGAPGQQVVPGQAVYTAENYVSDGTLKAGAFAFEKAVTGTNAFRTAAATGTGTPIGFVERNLTASITNPLSEATQVYNSGIGAPIALRGQFYAIATGTATEGQHVLCDPATGAVTYGDTAAANDTGWIVKIPAGAASAAEGDTVIYERIGA
ncbi:MAG: hypothetical protein SPL30_06440 [Succinivibrio sp.]|nr:hypothetical protein [Succinivibrio sp.]